MGLFLVTVRLASKVCGIVAAGLIASAILVVCQMVVIRYFLQASATWQTDYATFSLVGATLIGSPYILSIKGHVNVDLLPNYLGPRGKVVLGIIANSGGLIFAAVLAWYGYVLFHESVAGGWRTDTIWELPLWIPFLPLPLGIGLLALQYLADIIEIVTGRDDSSAGQDLDELPSGD
jgi:TRAP-type C4-dicarboxylate transport system permease small subunit